LRTNHQSEHIRIAVLPSIAQLWLSPRLPLLRKIDPTKTISITALERPPNLLREPYDLSLFFYDQYQLKWVTEICRDRIFPVCSPELAGQLKSPQDLAGSVFLHDTKWQDDWHYWMGKVIPDHQIDVSGPGFSLYGLAVQEAINGGGVLIGHESLVRNELDTGSLVAPFKERLELSQYLGVEVPSIRRKGSLTEKILDALQSI
jgi:DNA-binding transcriptional LysR family regulator